MKGSLFIWLSVMVLHSTYGFCQEIPLTKEQQLENLADAEQSETEDDAWLQDLEHFRKDPLHINSADAGELGQLRILNDLQIASLITYRRLFGHFISIYELQAVPYWDIPTIKKLIPFISLVTPGSQKEEMKKWFREGEHHFLLRVSQVFHSGKNSGNGDRYTGSPQRVLFRYRYTYKNLLQFGWLGDKDAGESFLKGAQKKGFDFYSAHFFARKPGSIQALALGDFTVNMGQGLIHWQSLAFKKSADITGLKRQSAVLRPYSSSGEFFFHRGAGITIKRGKIESTAFISFRKLSANLVTDTVSGEQVVTSLLTSGYHRSMAEQADRNKLVQTAFGSTLAYNGRDGHVAINGVACFFSVPVKKRDEPYNFFALSGKRWYNISTDYSYTFRNLHFFGEAAIDRNFSRAFINGLLLSVDPRVDISLLHRHISAEYQSVSGNAFTENTAPSNERGVFAGISLRPGDGWKIEAYADLYRFPWLKYRVDAPGRGSDFLVQLTHTASRQTEIYTRFRTESKWGNDPGNAGNTHSLHFLQRQSWRTHLNFRVNPAVFFRCRAEIVWYDKQAVGEQNGYLFFSDILYKPLQKPFTGSLRVQYFETEGYDSRVYAYENDVLYSYSLPGFSGKGSRVYLNLAYEAGPKLSFWVRWAQTFYRASPNGSGTTGIFAGQGPELKTQVLWVF